MKLLLNGLIKYISGVIIVGLLIFIPAGNIHFWNGWLLMSILFIPMLIAGIIMYWKAPNLLKRRLNVKEKVGEQKIVIAISGIMFISVFIIAGLNYRYQWVILPNEIVIASSILFIISYLIYGEVLRENEYLSRTIEVQKNQKLIDTGLYGIIRHPMYMATLFLFLSIPIVLGSIYSFLIMLIYPILIIIRLLNEEKVLEKDLKGYKEYKKKVKYRLIPYIW
jgi:protein-S-isoprenylcysteine O-methyltransferase Ste14